MYRIAISACLVALLSLTACGSGTSDNTLLTGTGGTGQPNTGAPPPFPTPTGASEDGTGLSMTERELAFASEILRQVNTYRLANSLGVLTWEVNLAGVALLHTEDIRGSGILTHDGPAPCAYPQDCLGQRLLTGGILYLTAGENIARGFEDPALLMEAWKNSPTHNAILLTAAFTKGGIGFLEGPSPINPAATGPWVTLNCTN